MHRLALFLSVLIILLAASPALAAPPTQQDDTSAREMITLINAWRVEQGLWPLAPNAELEALAIGQAEYVLSLPQEPEGSDIHIGPQGDQPIDRARDAGWPDYGHPLQIVVGENAYITSRPQQAIDYWEGSPVHRRAMSNPDYREIGVAALPHRFGRLYIVVFGGRPNVLPAMADAANGVLYLTNEDYEPEGEDGRIGAADEVQVFDAEGRPLTGWMPWAATIPLPDDAGGRLFVAYTDGEVQTLREVQLVADAVLLPDTVSAVVAAPTSTPRPTVTPTPAPVDEGDADQPAPTARPSATPTAAPATTGSADLTLTYDAQALVALNTSDRRLDISGLSLVQGSQSFAFTRWSQFAPAPLSAFPVDNCLRVVRSGASPGNPAGCSILMSELSFSSSQMFWLAGDFDVQRDGAVLATCASADGRCTVSLP